MTQSSRRPDPPSRPNQHRQSGNRNNSEQQRQNNAQANTEQQLSIRDEIIKTIDALESGLQAYQVRTLVEQAQKFGKHLHEHKLKTNHLRRFLDAVKQLKARLGRGDKFSEIDSDIAFLQPQLAYAAARKKSEMRRDEKVNPAKNFSDVITTGIKKVHSPEDFYRLVQLIEAIIAYHKEAGGE